MNDAGNGANAKRQVEQFCRNWWARFVGYVKRKAKERRAKKQAETPQDKAARRTTNATVWIALFTFISVAVSGGTLWVLKNTLTEIHTGGTDTHTLAQAAKTQSEKMSNMSDAADKIRQAAQDMVIQDQRIADNAQRTIEASSKQSAAALKASTEASRLDERAWVVLRQIVGIPELNKPWNLLVFFANTGKTPAKNVLMTCHTTVGTGESDESSIKFEAIAPDTRPTLIAPNDPSNYCSLDPLQPAKIPQVTQDVLDAFSSRKIVLFSYGFVTYEDVSETKHWLTFCRIMEPDGKSWGDCKTHNDTGDGDPPPN